MNMAKRECDQQKERKITKNNQQVVRAYWDLASLGV